MKRLLPILISLFFCIQLRAQIYIPIDTANFSFRKEESKRYLSSSEKFIAQIKTKYKGGERNYIEENFENLHKGFNEDLLSGDYIFDERFTKLISDIVVELKSKNPFITSSLNFYLSKDLTLNAFSMGDSTFVINLGTFYYLENEGELAAIISHEIGHLILNHTFRSLQRKYLTVKKDSRKQLSEIKSNKYNRGEKAFNRLTQILYTESGLRRLQENEADSIGYVMYRNTKYPHSEYRNAFSLLSRYDSIVIDGLGVETLRKLFNLPGLPFNEEWLKKEDFSAYDYSKYTERINSDSLKSHPEMEDRMALLKLNFPELEQSEKRVQPSSEFIELQKIAKFEQPACLVHQEAYGEGIYLCLLELQKDTGDVYFQKWLGIFFQKIYDARKSYTLNRYLDRVQPREQSESYMQFLNFIWNLKLNELKAIAEYYN
jgi:hypothetical protein